MSTVLPTSSVTYKTVHRTYSLQVRNSPKNLKLQDMEQVCVDAVKRNCTLTYKYIALDNE
jgi:hypothetical protein